MIDYEKKHSFSGDYFYSQTNDDLNFHSHIHNSFEFIFVSAGEMSITIHDKSHTIKAGEAALIFPNQLHDYKTEKFSQSYLCIFSPSYVNTYYQKNKHRQLCRPIIHLDKADEFVAGLQAREGDFYALKAILYEIVGLFDKNSGYVEKTEVLSQTIENIIRYMEDHFKEDISLKSMAKSLGYHYNYLSHILNETFHTNFATLLNDHRIGYAKYLIENSDDYSITGIAQECGYMSIRSFNRNFYKKFHTSPTAYRRLQINNLVTPPPVPRH